MSPLSRFVKRSFDIAGATCALSVSGPIILCVAIIARWDTKQSGFFRQTRVGLNGKCFDLLKIRTMRDIPNWTTTVTTCDDPRITRWGMFFRRTKLDELPQLVHVLRGEMSFVGPRPDVPTQWKNVSASDKNVLLSVRPGITGPASLKYRNEEALLATQNDPESFNRTVLFPDKIQINKQYVANYRFWRDLLYLLETFLGKSSATYSPETRDRSLHKPTLEPSVQLKTANLQQEKEPLPARRAA